MEVLAPIDGSECSFRALRFATEFVKRYDGSIHVVHFTDVPGQGTEQLVSRARTHLDEAGLQSDPEVMTKVRMSEPKYANRVGKDILQLVEEEDFDHVVMGHHGTGRIGRAILGSAAETVLRAAEVPSTIIP
jgi:nucleotide-binding universal stress UspA family protein